MNIKDWKEIWDTNDLSFHRLEVHKMLQKHCSLLCPDGRSKRFLIPLCGKTLDMRWLLDQGHSVVGVDCVRKALEDFYLEHGHDWTEKDVPLMGSGSKVFQPADEKTSIKHYFGNIFLFIFSQSFDGLFDCIWDKGSLVALNREDVKKYAEILKEVLKSGGKILLETYEFEKSNFDGIPNIPPPHPVFKEEVRSLYEPDCTVELIDRDTRIFCDQETKLAYYLIVKK